MMSRETLATHYGKHHAAYVKKTNAVLEEKHWNETSLESVVRRDVATAFTRWEQAQQVLATYNTELLAAAQDNLRVVRASYELGHLRLTDVRPWPPCRGSSRVGTLVPQFMPRHCGRQSCTGLEWVCEMVSVIP